MAKTRPGIDRITRQQVQATATAAEKALARHLIECSACAATGSDPYRKCRTWWDLAKQAHRARRTLKRRDQPETRNMNPLPGMPGENQVPS